MDERWLRTYLQLLVPNMSKLLNDKAQSKHLSLPLILRAHKVYRHFYAGQQICSLNIRLTATVPF